MYTQHQTPFFYIFIDMWCCVHVNIFNYFIFLVYFKKIFHCIPAVHCINTGLFQRRILCRLYS